MKNLFLCVVGVFVFTGCSTPATYDPPQINHQFAKDSEARSNKAMSEYFACLKGVAERYKHTEASSDLADVAQSSCDRYAKDYERHKTAYSMALRIGHPDELSYGQAVARDLYIDLVKSGRGFFLEQMLRN